MEHLFMQIFERRDWIASQLRQQGESYAQSVASNLLAAGGRLPSWLWSAAAGPDVWNTQRDQGPNREQMISGILHNLPQFTTPISRTVHSFYPSQNDRNVYRPGIFATEEFDLGNFQRSRKSVANKNDEPDMVMDSYDRMQESSLEHRNKKIKSCKKHEDDLRKKSVVEYTGRMTRTRSKAASLKTFSPKVLLDTESLTKTELDCRETNILECSAEIRSASLFPKERDSWNVTRSFSKAFEQIQEPSSLEEEEVQLVSQMAESECRQKAREGTMPCPAIQTVSEDNLTGISVTQDVAESIELIDSLDTQSIHQNISSEADVIEKVVNEEHSNEEMNHYNSLPLKRASCSCDSDMAISEETAPEFEGFSIEKPSIANGFTFDLPSLVKFELFGSLDGSSNDIPVIRQSDCVIKVASPLEEMKHLSPHEYAEDPQDAQNTYRVGNIEAESDVEMNCNDKSELAVPTIESLEIPNVQKTCIRSVAEEREPDETLNRPILLSLGFTTHSEDGDSIIVNETAPELEGFSTETIPISMAGFIFDDPNLQELSRERATVLEQLQRSMNNHDVISTDVDWSDTNESSGSMHLEESITHEDDNVVEPVNSNVKVNDEFPECISTADHPLTQGKENTDNTVVHIKDDRPMGFHQIRANNHDDSLLKRRSGSKTLPLSSSLLSKSGIIKPPCTPPVEKFPQRAFQERKGYGVDRLSCFPIYENSRSLKGNVNASQFSVNREPLSDVTSLYQNGSSSAKKFDASVPRSVKKFDASVLRSAKELENELRVSEALPYPPVKKSRGLVEKKTVNIVSNIQSFVPLVRQRQPAPAPLTGKRDVKVKALEAAEAAKRLADKKEAERRVKKEALRLERMKAEQENARQLELKQRQKEEDWKRKEATMAARKRQREEERREKQRKKNCPEGAQQQRREKEERELQCRAAEEREGREKALLDDPAQDLMKNTDNPQLPLTFIPVQSSGNLLVAKEGNRPSQSYEISPYRDSDDEDVQDDKRHHKKKFIPSWARRESLDGHLMSMREMDPRKIFSRKASFSLIEVLPRRTRQPPI